MTLPGKERLPTPDGGLEVISTTVQHPSAHIDAFRRGEISLMPPQYYLLTTLAEVLPTGAVHSEAAKEGLKELSRGAFGQMQINPMPIRHETEKRRSYLVYEGDEARGGPKGRRHRSEIEVDENKTIRSIRLHRNFDIFGEDLAKL